MKYLWDHIIIIQNHILEWKNSLWKNTDMEKLNLEANFALKELNNLGNIDKDMLNWSIYNEIKNTLKSLISSLKPVSVLQNPAMEPRHWIQLTKDVYEMTSIDKSMETFEPNDQTTLEDLLNLKLDKIGDTVSSFLSGLILLQ